MSTKWLLTAVGIGALLATGPVIAHHSFSAEFDANAPIELTGAVTKIEWLNPHVWFFIDVTDDDGDVTNWGMQIGSPNQLVRGGWTRRTMKIGDVLTVEGSRARDMSDNANARAVILASTGQRLFAASSQGFRTVAARRRFRISTVHGRTVETTWNPTAPYRSCTPLAG